MTSEVQVVDTPATVTKIGKAPSIEDLIVTQTNGHLIMKCLLAAQKRKRYERRYAVSGHGVYQIALKKEMPINDYVDETLVTSVWVKMFLKEQQVSETESIHVVKPLSKWALVWKT